MDLIDIGVNLAHDSFDADRDAVMQRAAAAGVRQMIVTGASVEGSRKAIELAPVRTPADCLRPPACTRTMRPI
jgi:TatD DNase family protein